MVTVHSVVKSDGRYFQTVRGFPISNSSTVAEYIKTFIETIPYIRPLSETDEENYKEFKRIEGSIEGRTGGTLVAWIDKRYTGFNMEVEVVYES